jgi:tripartite-type tricarboxylate transporter receptor subunit TctC
VTPEQTDYYVQLLRKVQEQPEWKSLMEQGAFNTTSLEGKEYASWVAKEEQRHVELMKAAGFLAEKK